MHRRLTPFLVLMTLGAALVTPVIATSAQALPGAAPERIAEPIPVGDPTPALPSIPSASLADTFELESRPGANRTIFLDFDGHAVSDTAWNDPAAGAWTPNGTHPAWDPAGDGAAFSDGERLQVQDIWARVTEDFAPFDVNVTTRDPGQPALIRTDGADQRFGAHILITPSATAHADFCGAAGCGGIAYRDWFGKDPLASGYPAGFYQPAWVFPQSLSNVSRWIADAASHEIGHTLALDHDGDSSSGYHEGTVLWGPIMGSPYDSAMTQWSKGEYPGANEPQDDLAIIAQTLPLRSDEAGPTVGSAGIWPSGATSVNGVIASASDVDLWALGTCSGPVTLQADPAPAGPNLDIELRLVDASGTPAVIANPPLTNSGSNVTGGLGATIDYSVAPGEWFARIDGVDFKPNAGGYSDYGSLGTYVLSIGGGCDQAPVGLSPQASTTPVAPRFATSTTLKAPKRAKAGSRPKISVTVRAAGSGTATGTVFITVGTKTRTTTLRGGTTSWKLPKKMSRKRKVKVVVTYPGDAYFAGSATSGRIKFR